MSYARLPDHSPIEVPDEKEEFSTWPPRNLSRLFSYKFLFGASLALWIATSATLGWVLVHRPSGYGNHAATSMPFPPGTVHIKGYIVAVVLTEIFSATTRRRVRAEPKVSFHRRGFWTACLVDNNA